MDFDRLTKLVEQRKHAIEERAWLQKCWDKVAEEMNRFGEKILEEENKIKHLEQKIKDEALTNYRIAAPVNWIYRSCQVPLHPQWYLGDI